MYGEQNQLYLADERILELCSVLMPVNLSPIILKLCQHNGRYYELRNQCYGVR